MSRALARFTVQHRRLRLRVRLLATITDVNAEFRQGRRLSRNFGVVVGFFAPAGAGARHIGTVVITCDTDLMEIIPHEVTHAVMAYIGGVHCSQDEDLATSIGMLTARIVQQLRSRGLEV